MRLTAPCMCRTLLALSCLSWILADPDGADLLAWDEERVLCTATLTPKEPCRQGQHGNTCPYLISLPPLTVHLPQEMRELEKIIQDLERLKDSVDELREMCADCRSGGKECRKQGEREQDKLNEGEDDMSWIDQRLPGINMDIQQRHGTDEGKVGNTEGDGDTQRQLDWREKERNILKSEREPDVRKEETQVSEHHDKAQRKDNPKDDKLGLKKLSHSEKILIVGDTVEENPVEKNNRERNTQNTEEASKQDQKHVFQKETETEKETILNIKSPTNTEIGAVYLRQGSKEKETLTEVSDTKKMSEDLDRHTDQEQEMRKEIERGLNVEQNNEKPKQIESIGHGKKEKTVKNEEVEKVREVGMETKRDQTGSQQRGKDGEISSIDGNYRRDFTLVNPTPDSTVTIRAGSLDSDKILIFPASSPPPLGVITEINHETRTTHGLTQGSHLAEAGISEPLKPYAAPVLDVPTKSIVGGPLQQIISPTASQSSTSRVKSEVGFQGHMTSTTTTRASSESAAVTIPPQPRDRSRLPAKKNMSSNTKASMKPLPSRGLKQKPPNKPEADQKLKVPKNQRQVNRLPPPDKRLKSDQKPKLPSVKPNGNLSKVANFSKPFQNTKPKPPKVLNSGSMPSLDHTPDQTNPPAEKKKTHIGPATQRAHQRPQSTNVTTVANIPKLSDEHKSTVSPNSKPGRNQLYPDRIKLERKQRPGSVSKTQTHQTVEKHQDHTPVQDLEFEGSDVIPDSPKRNKDAIVKVSEMTGENPSLDLTPKQGLMLRETLLSEHYNLSSQNQDSAQRTEGPHQRPVPELTKKKAEDPISKANSTLGVKNVRHRDHTAVNQTTQPKHKNPKLGKSLHIDSIKELHQNSSSPSSVYQDLTHKSEFIHRDEQNKTLDQLRQPIQKIPKSLQHPFMESTEEFGELSPFMATSDDKSVPGEKKAPKNMSTGLRLRQEMTPRDKTVQDNLNASPDQSTKLGQNIPNPQSNPVIRPVENIEYYPKSESESPENSVPKQRNYAPPDVMSTPSEKRREPYQTFPVPESMVKSDGNLMFEPKSEERSTFEESKPEKATIIPEPQKILTPTQKIVSESFGKSNMSSTPFKSDQELIPREESSLTSVDTSQHQRTNSHKKISNLNYNPDTEQGENAPEWSSHEEDATSEEKTVSDLKRQKLQNPDQMSVSEPRQRVDRFPTIKQTSDMESVLDERTAPDQVNTRPHQQSPSNQSLQKSNQTLATGSEGTPLVGTTFNQDLTIGKEPGDTQPKKKLEMGSLKNTKIKPPSGQPLKSHPKPPKLVTNIGSKPTVGHKTDKPPQTNQSQETPRMFPNPNPLPDEISTNSDKITKQKLPLYLTPTTSKPKFEPEIPLAQKAKIQEQQSSLKSKTNKDHPLISWTTNDGISNAQTNAPPRLGSERQNSEVTHSLKEAESEDNEKRIIQNKEEKPKTSDSQEYGPFPQPNTLSDDFTVSMNSRFMSDLKPITVSQSSQIATTPSPNNGMFPGIISTISPMSIPLNTRLKPNSHALIKTVTKVKEEVSTPAGPSPSVRITSTLSSYLRSTTPATSGLQLPAVESSTPSARELRVKISQVAAFLDNDPKGRPPVRHPKEPPEDSPRPDKTELSTLTPSKVSSVMKDCLDHRRMGHTRSGVYLVTPDLRSSSFKVFCDMELDGGGWTVLQRRQDGRVSFNRTWEEYRSGFGDLEKGEFWQGNDKIHRLTRDREMRLRIELEDFEGVAEYAQYEPFRVASERLRYRLTVGLYSGTAGDALRFNKRYDHNNRAFTTPDRDHDRYPSGNCGAYYSSGWWFDACMAANLNGRYYEGSYKGVRDGIYWGTWHNISTEYYPTNDRQSFKRVRMMIRPRGFAP